MRATFATEYICCGESYLYGLELPDNEEEALELVLTVRSAMDESHSAKHPERTAGPVRASLSPLPDCH